MDKRISPSRRFSGTTRVPGDKSISHRALIFGALAKGRTEVTGLLDSGDVRSTEACLRALGVTIERKGDRIFVEGVGTRGFRKPSSTLDCGNSGTTLRTLMGVLAGQSFDTELSGDHSLVKRPMKRVAEPLSKMGARIRLSPGDTAPLKIEGAPLHAIEYELKVASAQVKTAILLAGLCAEGTTVLRGELASRDHTERMLPYFGVKLTHAAGSLSIAGGQELRAAPVQVPGDPSSAAFWCAAACLVPSGEVEIEGVSLNPTRTGFHRVLERMGAKVEEEIKDKDCEPVGIVRVSAPNGLRATEIRPDEVPSLVDEIPLVAILATQAKGTTIVRGAKELRVKETDRIEAVATNLRALGIQIETFPDGFSIVGPQPLSGGSIDSFDDHRIAMAFSIAALIARDPILIRKAECVGISFPTFFEDLGRLTRG